MTKGRVVNGPNGAGVPPMTRPPDRFGLRRSTITTARGRFRSWVHNHRAADAQLASALERLQHGTSRGAEDDRAGMWRGQVPEQHTAESIYWVMAPDRMRSEFRGDRSDAIASVHIVNERGRFWWSMLPSGSHLDANPWAHDPTSNDLKRWHDPMDDRAVNGLLYPGWRYHGLTETSRRPVISALGRPAIQIDLVRTLPWSDPRTLGTDDWPWDAESVESVEVIEDVATGAVMEWRALFQGETYERHWWDELELDVEADPALFDPDVEPALAPWDGPFESTVIESPPAHPPVATIEDVTNPSIRQVGLLVGRVWNESNGRVEEHAREGHPVPDGVGPFGPEVAVRIETPSMPAIGNVFLFDAERRFIPVMLTILGDRVTSIDPVAGRFSRTPNGTIAARLTLPEWSDHLHLRVDVTWFDQASAYTSPLGNQLRSEYAFTLVAPESLM